MQLPDVFGFYGFNLQNEVLPITQYLSIVTGAITGYMIIYSIRTLLRICDICRTSDHILARWVINIATFVGALRIGAALQVYIKQDHPSLFLMPLIIIYEQNTITQAILIIARGIIGYVVIYVMRVLMQLYGI